MVGGPVDRGGDVATALGLPGLAVLAEQPHDLRVAGANSSEVRPRPVRRSRLGIGTPLDLPEASAPQP